MRSPNSGSVQFIQSDPPTDPAQLQRYLRELESRLAAAFAALAAGHLDKSHAPPAKPRDGDWRYADGTDWKPNGTGGKGFYRFDGGLNSWVLLG